VHTEIGFADGTSASRAVMLPELNDVALVGGLISDPARDPVYAEVVGIAATMAAAT
jgi:hypothetical protein